MTGKEVTQRQMPATCGLDTHCSSLSMCNLRPGLLCKEQAGTLSSMPVKYQDEAQLSHCSNTIHTAQACGSRHAKWYIWVV